MDIICVIDVAYHLLTRCLVRFNHPLSYFLSLVILLDSKAQQTELEWISYPPNGVSSHHHQMCVDE